MLTSVFGLKKGLTKEKSRKGISLFSSFNLISITLGFDSFGLACFSKKKDKGASKAKPLSTHLN